MKHKKTRFKIAVFITVFIMCACIYALKVGAYELAATCIAGLMIIGPAYIAGDSFRSSK